jgi:hypothetical protein
MFRRVHPASKLEKKALACWYFAAGGCLKHISAALTVLPGESWDRGTGEENPWFRNDTNPNATRSTRLMKFQSAS